MAKVFTLSEVAKHNSRDDGWIILFGKVLNVTTFFDEHPGGVDILLEATGKDATADFDGHSNEAWSMMEKFCIGELDQPNKATDDSNVSILQLHPGKEKKAKTLLTYFIQFAVPVIILNLIIAFFSKLSA